MRWFLVLAGSLLVLAAPPAAGEVAAHGERLVPAPADCRVAPRPFPAVAAAFGQATSPAPRPAGSTNPGPFVMPTGRPADEGALVGIVTTVQELLACENAGDWLRAFALYSDAFLPRRLAEQVADRSGLDALAGAPVPAPEAARAALLAVEDVRRLPDGRVGALVHADGPRDPRPEEVAFFTFIESGGRWVVDEVVVAPAGEQPVTAAATLRDETGTTIGEATLTQEFGGRVSVLLRLDGAPPGGHALHVHEVGACDAAGGEPFAAAGVPVNPGGTAPPDRAWDLGNAGTDVAGRGEFSATSVGFTLSSGPSSVLDADGSALVLHAGMDDGSTALEGNSGARIACGVIALSAGGRSPGDGAVVPTLVAVGGLVAAAGGLMAWQLWRRRHPAANRRTDRLDFRSARAGGARRGGDEPPAGERLVLAGPPSGGRGGRAAGKTRGRTRGSAGRRRS